MFWWTCFLMRTVENTDLSDTKHYFIQSYFYMLRLHDKKSENIMLKCMHW